MRLEERRMKQALHNFLMDNQNVAAGCFFNAHTIIFSFFFVQIFEKMV